MKNFKTYTKVNTTIDNLSFGISKMEEIFTKRGGKLDVPHKHTYYTVLVIEKGKGTHKIDFNDYSLNHCQVYFVAPGQVHQLIEEEKSIGYSMVFSQEFLIQNAIPESFIEGLNLFNNYGQSPPLEPNAIQFERILTFMGQIYELFKGQSNLKFHSIGSYLKLVLIECNNLCTLHPLEDNQTTTNSAIVKKFKEAVNLHYKSEHSIKFYADKLFITPDHLTRTLKKTIGISAKEYIQTRLITEAKRLIYFTNLTSKEIGYNLGFNEPANFSAFFKKRLGCSPSQFKNQVNSQ